MFNVFVADIHVKTYQTVQISNNQKAPTSKFKLKHINYNDHIIMQDQLNIKVE